MSSDIEYMQMALELASKAADQDEVPVGALLVADDQVISSAYNLRETEQSPCAHAEILAIEKAAKHLKSWRLHRATLYVTLEPCLMCAGAILQARIPRVFFATRDPKAGGFGSLYQLHADPRLNHQVAIHEGLCQEESSELLKNFFRKKRGNK